MKLHRRLRSRSFCAHVYGERPGEHRDAIVGKGSCSGRPCFPLDRRPAFQSAPAGREDRLWTGARRLGRRLVLLTYGLYLALFTGVTGWMILLSGAVERVVEGGPYLHGLVGTMMIAWGILAIRGLAPIVKRPLAMKDAWLLTLPCPAYLIAMVVSVRLVREFTHLPAPLVGAVLGTAFVALAGLSQLFLRAARGRPLAQTWQVAMALGMFSTGAYFLGGHVSPGRVARCRTSVCVVYRGWSGGWRRA